MRRTIQVLFIVILGMCVVSHTAGAADYRVDPARSEIVVRLFKGGIASALAHNHVIRATRYAGEAHEEPLSVWVEAEAASLVADESAMREKYGLTKSMGNDDRETIQSTMESAEQLNVARYPTIRFDSTKIEEQAEGQYMVSGNLTIHGMTRDVSFPAVVSSQENDLLGEASLNFKQSDFGIKPYSALFGAVRNKDEAVLHLKIYFTPEGNIPAD